MAFSAVFTYHDLICLKLSILFPALSNVKTKLFIVENEKNLFGTSWSQNSVSLLGRTSKFYSEMSVQNCSETSSSFGLQTQFLGFILLLIREDAISSNMAITSVQLTQQMPSVTFTK